MTVVPIDYIDEAFNPDPKTAPLETAEEQTLSRLRRRLHQTRKINLLKGRYYDGKQNTRHMNISVPEQLQDAVDAVSGWGGKVVDTVEERIDWLGWASTGDLMGLDEIYTDNALIVESSRAHIDALIYGISFMVVGTGDPNNDEPEILVTAESPLRATLLWDYRARRASAGLIQTLDDRNKLIMETLYLPNETITLERSDDNSKFEVTNRDKHNMNRVPMVRHINRDRASDTSGRSEITPPIRYYVDAAVRTLLGAEINREFYTTPMTFALNVRPEKFGVKPNMTDHQKAMLGWRIISGHVNIVPPPENPGDPPADIKQLEPKPPTPYIEQVKLYANLISSDSGVPSNYFGFTQDIAPSSDSIVAADFPLIRKATRRLANYSIGHLELGRLCVLWRDGRDAYDSKKDKLRVLRTNFANPATPTRSALADETQKYISSGVLIADSKVTYDRMGLSDQEQEQLTKDKEKARQQALDDAKEIAKAGALAGAGAAGTGTTPPGVQRNKDGEVPGSAPNPANVSRGKQIAASKGQG